jgi:predicted RNase H-like HicB family nuclease
VLPSVFTQPKEHEYRVVYRTIEDGWVMATAPELPGAVTQGKDFAEASENIKEAIELLLKSYRDHDGDRLIADSQKPIADSR